MIGACLEIAPCLIASMHAVSSPPVTLAAPAQAPNGGEDSVHDLAEVFLHADGFAIIKYCSR